MHEACWSEAAAGAAHPGPAPRRVDPVDVAVAIVDRGLRLLKMDATAARRVGLTGLHMVGGHPFAAQIWIAGSDGVHAIEVLPHVSDAPLAPAGAARADLLASFFPAPGTDAFDALTTDEQKARRDPGFDASGAPDHALTHALFGTPLFGVGLLRLALDPSGHAMAVQGLSGTAAGWAVVRPLLDLIVTLLAFVHRVAPLTVVGVAPASASGTTIHGLHAVLPCGRVHPTSGSDGPSVGAAAFVAAAAQAGMAPPASAAPERWWSAGAWELVPDDALCACQAADSGHDHDHGHGHGHGHGHSLAPDHVGPAPTGGRS